jgi:UPF0755 protein
VSVRGGRGPRDDARGEGHETAKPGMPTWRASDGRGGPPRVGRTRRDLGPRIPGFIKFIAFAGILAVFVLVLLLTALRPLVRAGVVSWAWDNPSWITRISFVDQLVKEDLGSALTEPAPGNATPTLFTVAPGDTIYTIGPHLQDQGFVVDQRAFLYLALINDLQPKLESGTFLLRHNMTPSDVVVALVRSKITLSTVNVGFREGIRLEQQTALLETIQSGVDPTAFYQLAMHPPQELLDAYPWLAQAGMPKGASLEGFLYPATYTLVTASSNTAQYPITDAEGLIRMELDKFYAAVGSTRMAVPSDRGLTFYQIVTLASIVQHETPRDQEKPLVAGVYQNRLDRLNGVPALLDSEPTVIWAVDTAKLRKIAIDQWQNYFFWANIKTLVRDVQVPPDLQGYQTFQVTGLIPGPLSTPTATDIDAALAPDQKDGYLYFLATPNNGPTVFAHTLAEQTANIKKYYPHGF